MKTNAQTWGAVAALVVIGSAGVARADYVDISGGNVRLSELLGQRFLIDDKEFEIKNFASATLSAENIFVQPLNFGRENGIGFELEFEFADVPGDNSPVGFDLEYNVRVLDPYWWIVDNILSFNGFAFGPGSISEVNETVFDGVTGAFLGDKRVFAIGDLPSADWQLSDRIDWDPNLYLRDLNVVKNFELFAPAADGVATASFIRQTFSQIPTPGAAAVMVLGVVAASRRRRA